MALHRISPEEALQMTSEELLETGRFQRRELAIAVGAVLSLEAILAFLALDDRNQVTCIQEALKAYKTYPETHPFIDAYRKVFDHLRATESQVRDLQRENQRLADRVEALEAKTPKKKKKKKTPGR